jgi:hypothetical protein
VETIREILIANRDFLHPLTVEYISEMVDLFHQPAEYLHTGKLTNDALSKTVTADLSPLSGRADEHDHQLMYPGFMRWLSTSRAQKNQRPRLFMMSKRIISSKSLSEKFLITEQGYLGLGPMTPEVGDLVCVLLGGNLPFVLRQQDNNEHCLFDESYVHGFVDSEAM